MSDYLPSLEMACMRPSTMRWHARAMDVLLLLGQASFTLLYSVASSIVAAGRPLIVEGFFGNPALRGAEFRQLQHVHDFEPWQILCKADGEVLLERFLARMESEERHTGHHLQDLTWIEQNKKWLLRGHLPPLALGGQLVEIDTTTPHRFDYADLLQRIHAALFRTRTR